MAVWQRAGDRMSGYTPYRYIVGLWFFTASLAFILCMYDMAGALVNGQFIPADHDSFYHARRIIDTIPHLSAFYQFDPRIHAPEGSWVTWPWAYDFSLALIAKSVMAVTGMREPMAVIAFIAPAWIFVNAALVLAITRQLRLSFMLQTVVMLSFALSTLTRDLHRVGMVDHHYVEHTFVLATLYCGLRWFESPGNLARAAWLGVVLGLAPAFHNGDFILQLPVIGALIFLWWLGKPIELKGSVVLAGSLVGTTTLALLPSEPFRLGMFSYTLHSWFHFYVAFCSAAAILFVAATSRRPRTIAVLLAGAFLGLLPLVKQIESGYEFLSGELVELDRMAEVSSVFDYLLRGQLDFMVWLYSCMIWILPVGVFWSWWRLRKYSTPANYFLAIYSLFGAVLLLTQFRLEYFGAFALWVLPCLLVQDLIYGRSPVFRRNMMIACAVVMLGATVPGLARLRTPVAPGGAPVYTMLRGMLLSMHDICGKAPGVVLADHNFGHYITYHTDCPVIADNFVLTRQHEEKLRLSVKLFESSVADVLRDAPYVRYILVSRADRIGIEKCFPSCPANRGLRHELLESRDPYPPALKFLGEVQAAHDGVTEPFARLFEVVHSRSPTRR